MYRYSPKLCLRAINGHLLRREHSRSTHGALVAILKSLKTNSIDRKKELKRLHQSCSLPTKHRIESIIINIYNNIDIHSHKHTPSTHTLQQTLSTNSFIYFAHFHSFILYYLFIYYFYFIYIRAPSNNNNTELYQIPNKLQQNALSFLLALHPSIHPSLAKKSTTSLPKFIIHPLQTLPNPNSFQSDPKKISLNFNFFLQTLFAIVFIYI